MKCGQGKPYKSYQMGGLVTKGPARAASAADPDEGVYTAKMGKPPYDPDNESAPVEKPGQRKLAKIERPAPVAKPDYTGPYMRADRTPTGKIPGAGPYKAPPAKK